MSEPTGDKSQPKPITRLQTGLSNPAAERTPDARGVVSSGDSMPCDRCGADTYRMHAVWRCPVCGFKTDCCGW